MKPLRMILIALLLGISFIHAAQSTLLYEEDFSKTPFGHTPSGWTDLTRLRPSRNWAVDGHGVLRQTVKNHTGLITYVGYTLQPKPAASLADGRIEAVFSKTEDETVAFGVAGRVQDRDNYYLARFSGTRRLELLRMKEGVMTPLDAVPLPDLQERRETGIVTLQPYRGGERWTLSLTLEKNRLTAVLRDPAGSEQARLGAQDDSFTKGAPGICCTRFASAASFRLESLKPVEITADAARLKKRNSVIAEAEPVYPLVKAVDGVLSTPVEKLAPKYDLVVAGAGTGGWAAAVQAARLGSRVLLIEESDWIGGQMAAAGVTTMDEDSVWMKFPVRERGLYREFHESITLHYLSREKDPQVAYYGWPHQLEGGYEPKVARAVLQGFIQQVKNIDVSLRTRVSAVTKQGDTVTGVTLGFADGSTGEIACTVLIDATEYGDVIPLTGARYRVGNQTSDKIDPASLVQDHTWTCIVREYPGGIPEHLIIKEPPPGYAEGSGKRYRNYRNEGVIVWGGAGVGYKGPRHWRTYFAWRGMADSESPLTGESSSQRHTQCGFNGGNDYPVTAATIEDPAQRLFDEREGIYKTLGALYYFQHELGVNWSLAEDEGYDTPANRAKMKALNLRPDLEKIAVHLPQHPYVRECRRIIGVQTLTAHDLSRFENAKHVRTAVAMGDYFMDLDHGETAHAIEPELDSGELPKGGGPFQVPFEVFIPETLDGFIPAEKNISQSRIANGATRLQPITMLTGQAAGTIAALAVRHGVQPRALNPVLVQQALLNSGCTLIQRWYADVPWGTELWRATQLLSLYQILDRPGDIDRENTVPLASKAQWGVESEISAEEQTTALQRIKALTGSEPAVPPETRHAGEFALFLAKHFVSSNKP